MRHVFPQEFVEETAIESLQKAKDIVMTHTCRVPAEEAKKDVQQFRSSEKACG